MQRRSFLSSILIAASAPAIVSARSLMPIYVPQRDIVVPGIINMGIDMGIGSGDFTVEAWACNEWTHVAIVCENNGLRKSYVNGILQPDDSHPGILDLKTQLARLPDSLSRI